MRSAKYNELLCTKSKTAISFSVAAFLFCVLVATGCRRDKDPIISSPEKVNLELVAENFVAPLGVVAPPDGSGRLFVIDQPGQIWIIDKDGNKLSTPFMDISSKMVSLTPQYDERGLLGLAFHPDYKNNGKFYLFYTAPPRAGGPEPGVNWNNLTRISEFMVTSPGANTASPSSERVLIEADHPQMNHNGGTIAFGPDGYLYISIGDGGGADDVGPGHVSDWYLTNAGGNAQNTTANLMGKILRINVNSGSPYSIPPDNPFVGSPMPEIYAYGFRNPYRFSFDMGGGHALYVGDAGQKLFEEIDIVVRGGNYGWNVKEGDICFNTDSNLLIRPDCPTVDSMGKQLMDPLILFKNAAHPDGFGNATVIVGGNVYRGNAIPAYQGRYIFGIFSQKAMQTDGKLYASIANSTGLFEEIKLRDFTNNLGQYVKGFGQDNTGEVYVTTSMQAGVSGSSGRVYKLVP